MSRSALCLSAFSFLPLLALGCSQENQSLGPVAEQWSRLAEGEWTLQPGEEDPRWCKKIILTEDVYVAALRPVHPLGTHHTTLSIAPDDGKATCTGSMFGPGLIYAAGLGTGELRMPKGVAMKLPAGQAVLLNLHIYNATSAPLTGQSAIEIVKMKASEVETEADMMLSGPSNITLPPASRTTISHTCRVSVDQNVFTLFPHMHQLGVHIKTSATVGGSPMVLHDGDYQFEEQYQVPVGPLALHAGDSITTECTYQNTRSETVRFGESSDTEMCFSILYRYPRGKSPFCTGTDEGGGQGNDGGRTPVSGGPCAKEGEAGNDVGVGKYCTPAGGQCTGNGAASLCLADFSTAQFANFCSLQCQSNSDCGTGALCIGSPQICVPSSCAQDAGGS